MKGLVPQPPAEQLFSDGVGVIRAALAAGDPGAGKGRHFTAAALENDALGAPAVDHAERYLLGFVMRFEVLDNSRSPSLRASLLEALTLNNFHSPLPSSGVGVAVCYYCHYLLYLVAAPMSPCI